MSLLNIAITAALEAGKVILEIYKSDDFEVEVKGDNSPLTRADTASHNVIMSYLETTDIPVLSEEGRDIPYKERKAWKQLMDCRSYRWHQRIYKTQWRVYRKHCPYRKSTPNHWRYFCASNGRVVFF